ncbi:helix-turn-helix domain-containing protein [Vibrio marisflavi]|uniref:HTH-type transcriptional activator RhaS n=1 Tax=Vibrio marisflavi CECT 7928 TaxID=634439 RepID=A0ABN8E4Q4_9VIBR|nr:AraC family transcriptional regulator [Vibrio marisflavi]CAH0539517.1 HTH-type transcriptional activator RhaS [Vibrio marisflavi CECT 7928]
MKAQFEKIVYDESCSWRLLIRELDEIPFEWHFHPEYELTLTLNSHGERYIDNCIDLYCDWDLTLLGPNIPHTWHSKSKVNEDKPHKVYVLWFDGQWVEKLSHTFPEYSQVSALAQLAHQGVQFSKTLAKELSPLFSELDQSPAARRLTLFLQILERLMVCEDIRSMNINHSKARLNSEKRQQQQLNKALEFIHDNYTSTILLSQIAQHVGMSESTLNRFFHRLMGQSVSQYLIDVRLARACSLLISTDLSIAILSNRAGFQNLSNFNRLFRKNKQTTPKEFRKRYQRKSA